MDLGTGLHVLSNGSLRQCLVRAYDPNVTKNSFSSAILASAFLEQGLTVLTVFLHKILNSVTFHTTIFRWIEKENYKNFRSLFSPVFFKMLSVGRYKSVHVISAIRPLVELDFVQSQRPSKLIHLHRWYRDLYATKTRGIRLGIPIT